MARTPLPFEEWQILYRQVLQLERALRGERQAAGIDAARRGPLRARRSVRTAWAGNPRRLSTPQLIARIAEAGTLLVEKEVALAREELRSDVRAEIGSAKLLAGALVAGLIGVTVLLVAAVFVLSRWMAPWAAALTVGGALLAAGAALGLLGWGRLVLAPLAVTRKTVTEDLQWVKERLA